MWHLQTKKAYKHPNKAYENIYLFSTNTLDTDNKTTQV